MDPYADEVVAILLACYNGEKYIERLMDSLAGQTHANFVCYMHDDGSTDHTAELIRKAAATDARFRMVEEEPTGGSKNNFMFLLGFAEEKYVMFCDQDDIWLPNKVEEELKQIKQLEAVHGEIPMAVFCNLKVVGQDGTEMAPDFMEYSGFDLRDLSYRTVLLGNSAPGCAMIINKPLRNLAVRCGDIGNIAMHDWWLTSIASLYGRVSFFDEKLILYCQHAEQVIGAVAKQSVADKIRGSLDLFGSDREKNGKVQWGDSIYRQVGELMKLGNMDDGKRKELESLYAVKNRSRAAKMAYFMRSRWGNRKQRAWLGLWY